MWQYSRHPFLQRVKVALHLPDARGRGQGTVFLPERHKQSCAATKKETASRRAQKISSVILNEHEINDFLQFIEHGYKADLENGLARQRFKRDNERDRAIKYLKAYLDIRESRYPCSNKVSFLFVMILRRHSSSLVSAGHSNIKTTSLYTNLSMSNKDNDQVSSVRMTKNQLLPTDMKFKKR
ncbi:hypothetical protein [Planococcus sp. ISL-110]|uniref:hypothetical protein n=1 Tax=Planococcus sp. ISL-110 TaxID=2819167 RepID=UPI001BEAEEC4|nr:hypothetical protein [Planococcus sp. ISL-110]MBT2571067.1 hypothetical protein [Planococcus sp. ISL-110]